jgi:hypothetical protein
MYSVGASDLLEHWYDQLLRGRHFVKYISDQFRVT